MSVPELVIVGSGEHAAVIIDMLLEIPDKWKIAGIVSLTPPKRGLTEFSGIHFMTDDNEVASFVKSRPDARFIAAIGSNITRRAVVENLDIPEKLWITLIHKSACVSRSASIGAGTVVMPRVVIQAYTKIGRHCIINTGAVIEHDNIIGDYVHAAPASVTGGGVTVKDGAFIGLNACVKDHVCVGSWTVVGAGAAVVTPVEDASTVVGVPARKISNPHG